MPQCCAIGCKTKPVKGNRLFSIPQGECNSERRELWLQGIGRKNWTPTKNSRLCLKHFTPDQFESHRQDGLKKLKPNAVPSIFGHRPTANGRKAAMKKKIGNKRRGCMTGGLQSVTRSRRIHSQPVSEGKSNMFPLGESSAQTVVEGQSHEVLQENPCFVWQGLREDGEIELPALDPEELQQRVIELQRRVNLIRRKLLNANREKEQLAAGIKKYFNDDQIRFLQKGNMNHFGWSEDTIQKALKLRLSCGSAGYNTVRELAQPLPSERTLQRKMHSVECHLGILIPINDSENLIADEHEVDKDGVASD